jgi:bifunctional oligoribonuclease and PAP phosphatase NrnA
MSVNHPPITASQFRNVWSALVRAERVLLVSPKKPDGDSVGSICGLYAALVSVGVRSVLYCPDPIQDIFDAVPHVHDVRIGPQTVDGTYDMIVVVDAGDLEFAGIENDVPRWLRSGGELLVIDHHATNTRYGTTNVVDPNASATTQVIADMLVAAGVALNPTIATCLLVGLVTDTDGFTNPGTSPRSAVVASQFMAAGARLSPILRAVYRNKSLGTLRLWGEAFSRLRVDPTWGVASTVLLPGDFLDTEMDSTDGLANFLQNVLPARAIMVLKDSGTGLVRGSLRTQSDDVDLGGLAAALGGGGHRKASGFGVRGRIIVERDSWKVVG